MKDYFWKVWAVLLVISLFWLGWAISPARSGTTPVTAQPDAAYEISCAIEKPDEKTVKELEKRIRKKRDEMAGITWYLPLEDSQFKLYIAVPDNAPPMLRFRAVTQGADWIFFRKIYILADHNRFTMNIDPLDRQTEVVVDEDWFKYPEVLPKEWIDMPVGIKADTFSLENFILIGIAEKVKVRFEGENYYRERELKRGEINALYDILQYYIWVLTDIGERGAATFLIFDENGVPTNILKH